MLVSLFGMVLLVRYLDSNDYGALAILMALPQMINVFFSLGYNLTITRYFPNLETKEKIAETFWRIFFQRCYIGIGVSILLVIFFNYYAESFCLLRYKDHFMIYQFAVISQIGSMYITILLNARYQQKINLIIFTFEQVARLSIICIGIRLGKSFIFFVFFFTVLHVIKLLFGIFIIVNRYGVFRIIDIFMSPEETKKERSYRRTCYFNELGTSFLRTDIDRYILAYFSQSIQVAIYAIATNILKRIVNVMPISMFKPLLEPAFYGKYDESKKNSHLNRMFQFSFKAGNILGFLYLTIFISSGKEIMQIVFKQQYAVDAYYPLLVFLIFLMCYSIPVDLVAKAIQKPIILLMSKVVAPLNIAIGIPMAIYHGALGIAVATALCILTKQALVYILLKRYCHITIPWNTVWKLLANSLSIMFVSWFLTKYFSVSVLLRIPIGFIMYFVFLKYSSIFNQFEKELLCSLMPDKIKGLANKML